MCRTIAEKMDDERVVIISMDNFYRPLSADERANVDGTSLALGSDVLSWFRATISCA